VLDARTCVGITLSAKHKQHIRRIHTRGASTWHTSKSTSYNGHMLAPTSSMKNDSSDTDVADALSALFDVVGVNLNVGSTPGNTVRLHKHIR
jgi:hypothetical protein